MKLSWNVLAWVAGVALGLAAPASWAQDKTVRIVVPAPPGSTLDATGRILAQRLAEISGWPHVVENRPGANTRIGADLVAHSHPDGRTLLVSGPSLVINALTQTPPGKPLQELLPVTAVGGERYSLVAAAGLKIESMRDLERLAASRPRGINCAAPPGPMWMACEQMRMRLRGAAAVVPYPGVAPAMAALAGGHVDVMFGPTENVARLVEAAQAEWVASASPARIAAGVPALASFWPDLMADSYLGVLVPVGTPEGRVRELHEQLAQALADAKTQERLRAAGLDPLPPGPADHYARLLGDLARRYGAVIDKIDKAGATARP